MDELIEAINNCALRIRRQLPQGYLEAVYKNAMVIELRKLGLSFETEKPIKVFYDGLPVGEYKADIKAYKAVKKSGKFDLTSEQLDAYMKEHNIPEIPQELKKSLEISRQIQAKEAEKKEAKKNKNKEGVSND